MANGRGCRRTIAGDHPTALAGALEPPRRAAGTTAAFYRAAGRGHPTRLDQRGLAGDRSVASAAVDQSTSRCSCCAWCSGCSSPTTATTRCSAAAGSPARPGGSARSACAGRRCRPALAAAPRSAPGCCSPLGLLTPFAAAGMIGVMVGGHVGGPPQERLLHLQRPGLGVHARRSPSSAWAVATIGPGDAQPRPRHRHRLDGVGRLDRRR